MSKPLRFTIFKMQRGGKILYRIRIPARFAASGKKTDLYYKTRAEAEEEQALLREKFANGELTLGTILGPGQVKDAQQALELLAEHKLNTSLLNAARAIVSLIKDNCSEISLVEAASLAIEQRKARMIGIPTKDLLIKYKEAVSEVRHWTAKHLANWRFYSTKFDSYFGEKNIADIQAPELREWFSKNFPSATYFIKQPFLFRIKSIFFPFRTLLSFADSFLSIVPVSPIPRNYSSPKCPKFFQDN